jgi:hypothetical protein
MSTNGGSIFIPAAVWPVIYSFDEPQFRGREHRAHRRYDPGRTGRRNLLTGGQILSAAGNYSYKSIDLLEQAQRLQEMSTASPSAGLDRRYFPDRGRHRRYEHHACDRIGADP